MLATRRRVAAVTTAALVSLAACGGSSGAVVQLDGSPRVPDAEGVVQAASVDGITLDGDRRYSVDKKLISFSTYNRKPVQLISMRGAFVHVGLDGDEVVWIAKIGVVARDAQGHGTTQYQGDLVDIDGSRLTFKDGTVLTLAKGLRAPRNRSGPTYVVIDADAHKVQGATFAPPTTTQRDARN